MMDHVAMGAFRLGIVSRIGNMCRYFIPALSPPPTGHPGESFQGDFKQKDDAISDLVGGKAAESYRRSRRALPPRRRLPGLYDDKEEPDDPPEAGAEARKAD